MGQPNRARLRNVKEEHLSKEIKFIKLRGVPCTLGFRFSTAAHYLQLMNKEVRL